MRTRFIFPFPQLNFLAADQKTPQSIRQCASWSAEALLHRSAFGLNVRSDCRHFVSLPAIKHAHLTLLMVCNGLCARRNTCILNTLCQARATIFEHRWYGFTHPPKILKRKKYRYLSPHATGSRRTCSSE